MGPSPFAIERGNLKTVAVAADLEVRLSGSSKRNDTDIAEAALQALKWNVAVPDEKITVTVRDGSRWREEQNGNTKF